MHHQQAMDHKDMPFVCRHMANCLHEARIWLSYHNCLHLERLNSSVLCLHYAYDYSSGFQSIVCLPLVACMNLCFDGALQAQLRGMISDFTDADESTIAAALGAFETLETSLEEFKKSRSGGRQQDSQLPASTRTNTGSGAPFKLQPPPGGSGTQAPGSQAPGQKPADEAPLISFD